MPKVRNQPELAGISNGIDMTGRSNDLSLLLAPRTQVRALLSHRRLITPRYQGGDGAGARGAAAVRQRQVSLGAGSSPGPPEVTKNVGRKEMDFCDQFCCFFWGGGELAATQPTNKEEHLKEMTEDD
jgi:hypothetical protein